MQEMDCRSFKDLLDSYLSQELAIETNHAVLRHAEQCGGCRAEMAARRQLRSTLRRACSRESMSEEACQQLRVLLHAAANDQAGEREHIASKPRKVFSRYFNLRFASVAATVALLFVAGLAFSYYLSLSVSKAQSVELSTALFDQSAEDHLTCATRFVNSNGHGAMPESVKTYDPTYLALDRIAEVGAEGLQLRSAHLCSGGGRKFAHLVYTRHTQVISLLVTERDGRSLKLGKVPANDGADIKLQQAARNHLVLDAYQTTKHIVLVVSDLPQTENVILAERLALPVAEHLRRVERTSTVRHHPEWRIGARDNLDNLIGQSTINHFPIR